MTSNANCLISFNFNFNFIIFHHIITISVLRKHNSPQKNVWPESTAWILFFLFIWSGMENEVEKKEEEKYIFFKMSILIAQVSSTIFMKFAFHLTCICVMKDKWSTQICVLLLLMLMLRLYVCLVCRFFEQITWKTNKSNYWNLIEQKKNNP